ncbi:hypothetical protein ABEB36_002663 [Hypothenemus hampei]|uniref:Tetratricopeptide repeat protein 21B n=1 Tax=Hypothenemus hampei TaxID=57062 RepID=A0ABD1F6K2_HYPHA
MEPNDYFAKLFYHFYHKHYNLMLNCCKDASIKFPLNLTFKLYHSLALILINRLEEGVHDLEGISEENDVKLAATIALMYGHKYLDVCRKEVFVKLDGQMKEYRKNAEAIDLYNSAFVLLTFKKVEKALDYVEKAISMSNSDSDFLALKAWILLILKTQKKSSRNEAKSLFKSALQYNPRNLLASIGFTESCLHSGELSEAVNFVNQTVVKLTHSNLPLLQRIQVHFASQNWEQVLEAINSFTPSEGEILYTLHYEILIGLLVNSHDYKSICDNIKKLSDYLKKFEPKNVVLLLKLGKLYSRLCNRKEDVLKETMNLIEIAIQNNIDNAELIVELGNQNILLGRTKEAVRLFKSATKIDENCFSAFLGLSLSEYLENGKSEALYKQIEFLLELKDASVSLQLQLLKIRSIEDPSEVISNLNNIFETIIHSLTSTYFSDHYLIILDPDFSLEAIKEYLQHNVNENKTVLERAVELANILVKACPSLSEGSYLQAKLQYLKGDNTGALNTLMNAMPETKSSDAMLLLAQIQVNNGQFDRALQSLETCSSSSFKVRENPLYHYLNALIDKHTSNYGGAIKALTTALSLANTKKIPNQQPIDKASIYVELIDTLNIVGQADEALKVLEEATEDLKETQEESRIFLLSADNLLARKNVQGAIDLLRKIRKDDACYRKAMMKIAYILLKYRRDRYGFLEVYQAFVAETPSAETYNLLGDAYMEVLESDHALDSYENALKENPTDPMLISKMGKALVTTHYFKRAVEYYKKVIKQTNDSELKLELANLYLNIREYEKGELLLLNEVDDTLLNMNLEDISHLNYRTRLFILLSQIQEKSGNFTYAIKSLKDAMDCQIKVRKRIALEEYNTSHEDTNQQLVALSMKLGEIAIAMKNKEQAVNYYKEGLAVSPNNIIILVAMAKIYMQMNYLELCQQTCNTILRINPENEEASVMMADIAFRKVDFDMALFHFTQLISNQPTNWVALIRLIEISRRLGNIESCEQNLNIAEEHCIKPLKDPGFVYCKAYYQWHTGNLNAALKNFNLVRQDQEYGIKSLRNMIEICLNPDDEMIAEQLMDSDDIEYRDSRVLALKTADRLIKELKQRLEANGEDLLICRLFTNFRLLATKEKHNIEQSLEDFIAIASLNPSKENLGATLGMSTAYTLLKQPQRAKNQLKRIVKSPWTFDDAEYLEKCWLLLADQYIQSNKLESAKELIMKVIEHNKACVKALQYLGFICEKEHKFKDASSNYALAWKVGQKSNANIGYKLAYCLMKCKKYPDAIDTANEVLKLNADYANIKRDILEKCMNNLRI